MVQSQARLRSKSSPAAAVSALRSLWEAKACLREREERRVGSVARRWDSAAASLRLRSADFFWRWCQCVGLLESLRLELGKGFPGVDCWPIDPLTARAWRALNLSCLSLFLSAVSEADSDTLFVVVSSSLLSTCAATWMGVAVNSSFAVAPWSTSSIGASEDSLTLRLFDRGMLMEMSRTSNLKSPRRAKR